MNGRLHPIWRVLLYVAAFFVTVISTQALVAAGWVLYRISLGAPLDQAALAQMARSPAMGLLLALSVVQVIDVLILTYLFRHFIDRKPFWTLGLDTGSGWALEASVGFGLGLAVMGLIFVVEIGAGWAVVRPAEGSWATVGLTLVGYLVTYVAVAVNEELMFRGYLLQTLIEWPGTLGAALISALIFRGISQPEPGRLRIGAGPADGGGAGVRRIVPGDPAAVAGDGAASRLELLPGTGVRLSGQRGNVPQSRQPPRNGSNALHRRDVRS